MYPIPYILPPAKRPYLGLGRREPAPPYLAVVPGTNLVQKNTNTSASTTGLVVTLGANTTKGDTLIATTTFGGGALTMSGGGVTTWTQIFFFGSTVGTGMYYGYVDTTPSTTITFTFSPAEQCVGRVMEWAGKLVLGQSTSTSGSSVSPTTGSITPAQSNELVVGLGGWTSGASSAGPTNGFADQGALSQSTTLFSDTATLLQGTAAAISTGWTIPNGGWDCCIASFILDQVTNLDPYSPLLAQ